MTRTAEQITAEERAALEQLARAKRQRMQAQRIEVADEPVKRRVAPEQADAMAKALSELAGKDASKTVSVTLAGPFKAIKQEK